MCKQVKIITGNLPEVLIMENVEEIQEWGPLDKTGHPIKERKGEDYKKFIDCMQKIGFSFDSKELIAADYGALSRTLSKQKLIFVKTLGAIGLNGSTSILSATSSS